MMIVNRKKYHVYMNHNSWYAFEVDESALHATPCLLGKGSTPTEALNDLLEAQKPVDTKSP